MKGRNVFGATKNFLLGRRAHPDSRPPYFLALRSSTVFINITVSVAVFTDIFFYGLVVPVLPYSLNIRVGIPDDQVQSWTAVLLACYNATLFAGSPIIGWIADRTTSRRAPLLFGLLALAGSTLMLCLGRSITLLLIGRLLQGLSAAIVWSVGLALLADTMGRKVGATIGYVSIAMSTGLLISPLIGGAVYNGAGYYAVYEVAFGVIFVDIVLRLLLIEKKVARQWTDEGCENASPSMQAVRTGTTNAGNDSAEKSGQQPGNSRDSQEPPPILDQPAEAAAAADTSRSRKHPNIALLTSGRMLAALFGCVIVAGGMFAYDTVLPLFVKDTFNWSSTAAGLIFITIMVPGFLAPLVGVICDRYGAKWPALAGFVASIPIILCQRFVTQDTLGDKALLCVLLALVGTTLIVCNTALAAEITYTIDDKEKAHPGIWGETGVYGSAYGLFTTSFALGGTIGSIMSGEIVATAGWGTMTWSLALWYVAALPVVWWWVGGRPGRRSTTNVSEPIDNAEGAAPQVVVLSDTHDVATAM